MEPSEDVLAELERKFLESRDAATRAKAEAESIQKKYSQLLLDYDEFQKKHETKVKELEEQLAAQGNSAEETVASLKETHEAETQELASALKSRAEEYARLAQENAKLKSEVQEVHSTAYNNQFQISTLEKEKANLQEHVKWLEQELQEKNEAHLTATREKSKENFDLKAELQECRQELATSKERQSASAKRVTELQEQLDLTLSKLKAAQDDVVNQQEQAQASLTKQTKLSQLYQEKAEEAQRRVSQLEQDQQAQKDIQDELRAQANKLKHELDATKEELHKEREAAQTALVVSQRVTGAELAPASTESRRKMLLVKTEMKLEETERELQFQKNENRRMANYINEIMREIEQKAPIIEEQRREYEKMRTTYESVSKSLQQALASYDKEKEAHEDDKRKALSLERENADLSRQVQLLLKECLDKSSEAPELSIVNAEEGSAQEVISNRLVTFKDIQELQQRNQELLRVVRQLSADQEENTRIEQSKVIQSLRKELENLREARLRQEEQVAAIIRQRDMYRVLLAQNDSSDLAAQMQLDSTDQKPDSSGLLRDLQKEFDEYKKETATNEKMLQQKVDQLNEELSRTRLDLARAQSQADFMSSRYNMLSDNYNSQNAESSHLRERLSELQGKLLEHERLAAAAVEERVSAQEAVKRLQVAIANTRAERDLHKANEERLLANISNLNKETAKHTALLENLQTQQVQREDSWQRERQHYVSRLQSYETEREKIVEQLAKAKEEQKAKEGNYLAELQQRQEQIEKHRQDIMATKENLIKAESSIDVLKKENSELKCRVNELTIRLKTLESVQSEDGEPVETVAEQQLRSLRMEFNLLQTEHVGLKEQLDQALERVEHYKSIAATHEESLKEMTEHHHAAQSLAKELEGKIDLLEKEREQVKKLNAELENQIQELYESRDQENEKLKQLQLEKQSYQKEQEAALKREEKLTKEMEAQNQRYQEAQSKYAAEMVNHATDLKLLESTKQALNEAKQSATAALAKQESAEAILREQQASWKEQKCSLENQLQSLNEQLQDSQKQNELLHSQLESLTEAAKRIPEQFAQEKGESMLEDTTEGVASSSTTEGKTVVELRQVIKYLRREKEILQCKLEVYCFFM